MNLQTLLNRTLSLGSWGVMTLYHMSIRLLLGLLLFFFPDQAAPRLLVDTALGTRIPLELIPHVSRYLGLYLITIASLFGLFGSVNDAKARFRLTYFALLSSFTELVFCAIEIYLKSYLIRTDLLVTGIIAHFIGMSLCGTCLFVLTNPPKVKGNGKPKKNK